MARQRGSQFSSTVGSTTVIGNSSGGGTTQMTIQDEGVNISTVVDTINFIGADVRALAGGSSNIVLVYIPPPTFASHYNTTDGTTTGTVSDGLTRFTTRISTPTSEGNPFKTNGWAGTNQATTRLTSVTIAPAQDVTGFSANSGGDAKITVTVFDADGTTSIATHTTGTIYQNGSYGAGNIQVNVTNYAVDSLRFKAKPTVVVDINSIFTSLSRQGGRYNVRVSMTTDTATDGSGPYTFTMTSIFFDTNPNTPSISGAVTIGETSGQVQTKHLSGIEYYIGGSQFTIDVQDVNNLNRNTARTTNNLNISSLGYNLPGLGQSPFGSGASNFSNWTNAFDNVGTDYQKTNWAITGTVRYRGSTARVSAFPRDTWASGSTVNSSTSSILVDTFGTTSTNTLENFDDENRRQTSNFNTGNTAGNWTSTNALVGGEAIVIGGQLMCPSVATLTTGGVQTNWSTFAPTAGGANPNYTGFGAPVSYYRSIVDTSGDSRSSFSITFTGTFVSNATTDLANQHLKIFISRIASSNGGNTGYNNTNLLLVHGAQYNFATFNDGVTDGHIREGSSSGNTVNCTFGGLVCEDGFFIHIQIANTAIKLSSFEVTFF